MSPKQGRRDFNGSSWSPAGRDNFSRNVERRLRYVERAPVVIDIPTVRAPKRAGRVVGSTSGGDRAVFVTIFESDGAGGAFDPKVVFRSKSRGVTWTELAGVPSSAQGGPVAALWDNVNQRLVIALQGSPHENWYLPDARSVAPGSEDWTEIAGYPDSTMLANLWDDGEIYYSAVGTAVWKFNGTVWASVGTLAAGDSMLAAPVGIASMLAAAGQNTSESPDKFFVHRSTNGGVSFVRKRITSDDLGIPNIKFAGADPSGKVYAWEDTELGNDLIRSADGGDTWTVLLTLANLSFSATQDSFACHRTVEGLMAFSYALGGDYYVIISTDFGDTWTTTLLTASPFAGSPRVAIGSDQTVYAAYIDSDRMVKVIESRDFGVNWSGPYSLYEVDEILTSNVFLAAT